MDILGRSVVSKAFGRGVIIGLDKTIMTIRFDSSERRFQYPDSFRAYLTTDDQQLSEEIAGILAEQDAARIARIKQQQKQAAVARKSAVKKENRPERPNIAFKCNYCDGGASATSVGFQGVCSDEIIYNNIEVEHRTWCCSDDCGCLQYLRSEITRKELDDMCEDGFLCYESQMLRDWKAMAGVVQHGDRKGQPMHLNQVQTNSLCILTTRDPVSTEEDRYIFAVFLIDDSYSGDNADAGFVSTRSEFKIQLSPDEAHQMRFWTYHANGKQPDVAAWNSGLHRYLTDQQALQILRDIAQLKQGTADESLANAFLTDFSAKVHLDVASLPQPEGAIE